jgi:hypothetical protein
MSYKEFIRSRPEPIPTDWKDLARVAIEFTHKLWRKDECEYLFPQPLNNVYWTIRLGRFALCRDGSWAYWEYLRTNTKEDLDYVRQQRFETIEEAIAVVTQVFGQTPEDGLYQLSIYGAKNERNRTND